MKVILLFDNAHREYELNESLTKHLKEGKCVSIRFCDPEHGEIMEAKAVDWVKEQQ